MPVPRHLGIEKALRIVYAMDDEQLRAVEEVLSWHGVNGPGLFVGIRLGKKYAREERVEDAQSASD